MAWTVGSVAKPTSPVVSIFFFLGGGGGGGTTRPLISCLPESLLIKKRIRPCTYCTSCDITHYVDYGR